MTAGTLAVAVANVQTVLERVETLEASGDPEDQAAVDRLTKVRFDAGERARLGQLVQDAKHFESESGAGLESDEPNEGNEGEAQGEAREVHRVAPVETSW